MKFVALTVLALVATANARSFLLPGYLPGGQQEVNTGGFNFYPTGIVRPVRPAPVVRPAIVEPQIEEEEAPCDPNIVEVLEEGNSAGFYPINIVPRPQSKPSVVEVAPETRPVIQVRPETRPSIVEVAPETRPLIQVGPQTRPNIVEVAPETRPLIQVRPETRPSIVEVAPETRPLIQVRPETRPNIVEVAPQTRPLIQVGPQTRPNIVEVAPETRPLIQVRPETRPSIVEVAPETRPLIQVRPETRPNIVEGTRPQVLLPVSQVRPQVLPAITPTAPQPCAIPSEEEQVFVKPARPQVLPVVLPEMPQPVALIQESDGNLRPRKTELGFLQVVPVLDMENPEVRAKVEEFERLKANHSSSETKLTMSSKSSRAGSSVLKSLSTKTLTPSSCKIASNTMFHFYLPTMLCVDPHGGFDTVCEGDSGGPLMKIENERYVQIGLTSFGSPNGCNSPEPPAFTRLKCFADYICQKTGVCP
ncbi:unnamed protein product [Notodromas monacha]|uniref:Peptidase S1 domain-containing protein n=1 Tax=Notodromas monacha TaxID=399045 RepID=A0A7R9GBX1_9CRUS|nr:unnamed protein product [Notodromas monacha]CAG0915412.1 unnamed protein product [Notodromas monacha]